MRILYAGLLLCVALIGLATLHFMRPSSEALIRQANAEGELRIYGNADTDAVQPLIESFRARHPGRHDPL